MRTPFKKILFSVFLIVCAAAVILSALNILPNVGTWHAILTVVLAALFLGGIYDRSFFMIIMPLAVIAIIYAEPLHITQITPWPLLLASFLVSVALSTIFPKFKRKSFKVCGVNGDSNEYVIDGNNGPSTTSSGSYEVTEVNFGAQTKYFNSQDFVKASFEVNFGSIMAYFVDAGLHENHGEVNIECNFGSVEVFVPKTWSVITKDTGAFHGIDEKGVKTPDGINTLYINCETNFGGITIHYV